LERAGVVYSKGYSVVGAPKLLAYYLPQFHQIPENDQWHGTGFTEWVKVKGSGPLFDGHRQPRVPHEDIGYYDLSDPITLVNQATMAKNHEVDGLIFYHYWFGSGKMILEKPARDFLDNKSIEIEFCFAWCNENWTRRWDGGNNQILLEQTYFLHEYAEFVSYLVPFMKDPRYVTIKGRPLLIIYRPHLVPDLTTLMTFITDEFAKHGVDKPYFVASRTWGENDFDYAAFDALSEKPLYDFPQLNYLTQPEIFGEREPHKGYIFEYADVVKHYVEHPLTSYLPVMPSCSPGWDVSPRHGSSALILVNESPEGFRVWLRDCIERVSLTNPLDEQFVFINAWNEWAEGAYLEPDTETGYAYLEVVKSEAQRASQSPSLRNSE
jgi:O-antigen biosynthesis protein